MTAPRMSPARFVALALFAELLDDRDPNQNAVSLETVRDLETMGLRRRCGAYTLVGSRREVTSEITEAGREALAKYGARYAGALAAYKSRYDR